jgi:hypothetical protein
MLARASAATNPSLRDRGFHTTPTCGVFGATIAAARLLKLDRDATVSALGLAGAQASGLMEMYGPSMQKRFNPGPSARNGVTAAWQRSASPAPPRSRWRAELCRAFSDRFDVGELTKDLGKTFRSHGVQTLFVCAADSQRHRLCLNIRQSSPSRFRRCARLRCSATRWRTTIRTPSRRPTMKRR